MALFSRKSRVPQPKFETPTQYVEDEDVAQANEYAAVSFKARLRGDLSERAFNDHLKEEALGRARAKGKVVLFNMRTGLWESV